LERVPADIRRDGGVARMSDPAMIRGIQEAVTIPVMAKARIGHFAEAQVLEALEVDYVDESEVLTPADEANHIDKWLFKVPFVCGATNLGEALRRIGEGAAMILGIQEAVTIPVMAKARIGHFVEAQVLEALEVDYIDESEVLTPADEANHIDKWAFNVPFVCGATNLGEALRRIGEGAAMIRSKGEAGTGDIVEAVRHLRVIRSEIRRLTTLDDAELATAAKELQSPLHLARQIAQDGRLPVVLFCAGGIATPADAALVMQLGAEGVFVGSGIFKSEDPERRARAIVEATTHYRDPARIAAASNGLGQPMVSLETSKLESEQLLAGRGW
ncbi:MAG: hypothetical protein JO325_06555, partial [Solirubrobacterales bacterium]|nr:hypothetical protein [Solirubrobacterales bacterium]